MPKRKQFLTVKFFEMKLTKFELEKMPVAEMNAIKAGSGDCNTGGILCHSATKDADNFTNGDSDGD